MKKCPENEQPQECTVAVHEFSVKGQYHTHTHLPERWARLYRDKQEADLESCSQSTGLYRKFPLDVAPVTPRSTETEVMSALDSLLFYSPLSRVTVTVNLSSAPHCARPQPATTVSVPATSPWQQGQAVWQACARRHTHTHLKNKNERCSELQYTWKYTESLWTVRDGSTKHGLDFCSLLYCRPLLLSPTRFWRDNGQINRPQIHTEKQSGLCYVPAAFK